MARKSYTGKKITNSDEQVRDSDYWVRFITLAYLDGVHRGMGTIMYVEMESGEPRNVVLDWDAKARLNASVYTPNVEMLELKVQGLLDKAVEHAEKVSKFDLPSNKANALARVAQTFMQLHGLDAKTRLERDKYMLELEKLKANNKDDNIKGSVYVPDEDPDDLDLYFQIASLFSFS